MSVSVFSPCFRVSQKRNTKQNKIFAMIFLGQEDTQRTWSACQESHEAGTRSGGVPPPLWALHSSTDVLLPPIYTYVPPNHQRHPRKPNSTAATFCTREIPSWGLFRRPAGGGIDHGGLLHLHHSLSDDV